MIVVKGTERAFQGAPIVGALDDRRGTGGMLAFIATEAALFAMLFFSYYFLAKGDWRWLNEEPPKLTLAFIMLAILISSSFVLHWGERQVEKHRRYGAGRAALLATILMGVVFLAVQGLEYRNHLQHLTPQTNAYGSIFYTITSFHAAHVCLGLLMLTYVLLLPRVEPAIRPPHRPYHNVAMYWHFVDAVWILIVALLYVVPNLRT